MARSCKRQTILFDTADGEVTFSGRPGGSKDCPALPRREATVGEQCSRDVFAKAVEYCRRTSHAKDKALQQKLCVGPIVRRMALAVKCSEKVSKPKRTTHKRAG